MSKFSDKRTILEQLEPMLLAHTFKFEHDNYHEVWEKIRKLIANYLDDKVRGYKIVINEENNNIYDVHLNRVNIQLTLGIGGKQVDGGDAEWTTHNITIIGG